MPAGRKPLNPEDGAAVERVIIRVTPREKAVLDRAGRPISTLIRPLIRRLVARLEARPSDSAPVTAPKKPRQTG